MNSTLAVIALLLGLIVVFKIIGGLIRIIIVLAIIGLLASVVVPHMQQQEAPQADTDNI